MATTFVSRRLSSVSNLASTHSGTISEDLVEGKSSFNSSYRIPINQLSVSAKEHVTRLSESSSALKERVINAIKPHLNVEIFHSEIDVEDHLKLELERGAESAFYVADLGTVVKKYEEWVTLMPRVRPFYAVKCNPNSGIVRTLVALGCGFDCASKKEVEQVLSYGVPSHDVIFANPCKMNSHIQYVRSVNVATMTFDNEAELMKMKNLFPEARLVLRLLPPDAQSAVCCFGSKFGADFSRAKMLLQLARKLELNIVGVSFHVGSGCYNLEAYVKAIQLARDVFDYALTVGYRMSLLDIGGGWPGCNEDTPLPFPTIAATVTPLIDRLFSPDVEVIAEPGRYFSTECASLAVNIIAKRGHFSDMNVLGVDGDEASSSIDDERPVLYYVSDGVYGSFNNTFFDHAHVQPYLLFPERSAGRRSRKSTLFGPTCDSIDKICEKIDLPDLDVGDWLYFTNMGAYTMASSSAFNGFEPPPCKYVMTL